MNFMELNILHCIRAATVSDRNGDDAAANVDDDDLIINAEFEDI